MLIRKNKIAQSTLEYILVLTAIVGLLIYAAVNWIKPGVKTSLENAGTAIGKTADRM